MLTKGGAGVDGRRLRVALDAGTKPKMSSLRMRRMLKGDAGLLAGILCQSLVVFNIFFPNYENASKVVSDTSGLSRQVTDFALLSFLTAVVVPLCLKWISTCMWGHTGVFAKDDVDSWSFPASLPRRDCFRNRFVHTILCSMINVTKWLVTRFGLVKSSPLTLVCYLVKDVRYYFEYLRNLVLVLMRCEVFFCNVFVSWYSQWIFSFALRLRCSFL